MRGAPLDISKAHLCEQPRVFAGPDQINDENSSATLETSCHIRNCPRPSVCRRDVVNRETREHDVKRLIAERQRASIGATEAHAIAHALQHCILERDVRTIVSLIALAPDVYSERSPRREFLRRGNQEHTVSAPAIKWRI